MGKQQRRRKPETLDCYELYRDRRRSRTPWDCAACAGRVHGPYRWMNDRRVCCACVAAHYRRSPMWRALAVAEIIAQDEDTEQSPL